MLSDCRAFATLPVDDLARVRSFYVDTLGLQPADERDEMLVFDCAGGTSFGLFVSQGRSSGNHTQMTFFCDDIDAEVADLRARGVEFEAFDMPGASQRDGVYELDGFRGAWFRDPQGNLLAVGQGSAQTA